MFYIYTPKDAASVYPFSLTDLRRLHTNVSWSATISDETAAEYHCFPVQPITPNNPPTGKKAVRAAPELVDGVWFERWALADITADETAAQWSAVRAERNAKLSASDWTQIADAPVDDLTWAAYRQTLRDLPSTQTDPFRIVWPTPPTT